VHALHVVESPSRGKGETHMAASMKTAKPRECALAHSACQVGMVDVSKPVPSPVTASERRGKRRQRSDLQVFERKPNGTHRCDR